MIDIGTIAEGRERFSVARGQPELRGQRQVRQSASILVGPGHMDAVDDLASSNTKLAFRIDILSRRSWWRKIFQIPVHQLDFTSPAERLTEYF